MSRALKVAIQKSGRLSDDTKSLFAHCDFHFPAGRGSASIRSKAMNFPLEVLAVRDDDIPQYVADGVVDLGIVGDNVRRESGKDLQVIEKLNYGFCRLSLAVPIGSEIGTVSDLQGKRIATSYPRATQEFLTSQGIEAHIHLIQGSVEVAPSLGLADAVSDLVGTGSTLMLNGLRELQSVFESQAVLISKGKVSLDVQAVCESFLFRVRAVERGRNQKYLLLNVESENLERIKSLLPGLRSPTVVSLANSSWVAVHSVVPEHGLWEVIEKLKAAGAEGILVAPIEKMIA